LGGFHSQAGWLALNAVVLGLLFPAHRSGLFARPAPARPDRAPGGAAATVAYLAPFLAALTLQMFAESVLPDPAAIYPLRAATGAALLWWFWPRYDGLGGPRPTAPPATGLAWALAVGAVVFLAWLALVPAAGGSAEPAHGPGEPTGWAALGWVAARAVGYVLITPMAEELAFRGYLLRRLVARDFRAVPYDHCGWPAVLVSSALFGLLHGHWLAGVVAGLGYALVAARTGRLRHAVLAHAVTNALLLGLSAATGVGYE
jgi:CAAX prenyl protease-like protein